MMGSQNEFLSLMYGLQKAPSYRSARAFPAGFLKKLIFDPTVWIACLRLLNQDIGMLKIFHLRLEFPYFHTCFYSL
jgi:hypothetical protein